mgnify:CR=1 FL=1
MNPRVLVVDDEPAIRKLLSRLLRGYDVTALSANDALERVLSGATFHSVLCDLAMPSLTGREWHDAVRRVSPELAERIVFVTGGGDFRSVADLPNVSIEKPIAIDVVRFILEAQLAKYGGEPAGRSPDPGPPQAA